MQHVIVTATEEGVSCKPNPIQIYRDDQFIRFSLGPNTAWDANPIVFGPTWPGGPANLDVSDTYIANGNTSLTDSVPMEKYSVTFNVRHIPTSQQFSHDPEIENQPEP